MATTIVTKYGSDAPAASDIVRGELAVDTENGRLYTENSSAAVVELGSNPSGNITFADDGKAIFGAGSDLQIFHDGSHSYVSDQGTGNIKILADDFILKNSADTETMIQAFTDAAVSLWYDNSAKLTTTSTGIDVTGSVTTDGIINSQTSEFFSSQAALVTTGSTAKVYATNTTFDGTNGSLVLQSRPTAGADVYVAAGATPKVVAKFLDGGDVHFFEDTGTTAKLTWDASAEMLTTSGLTVDGSTTTPFTINVSSTVNGTNNTTLGLLSANNSMQLYTGPVDALSFATDPNDGGGADKRLNIAANGDISFYEDTGTTAKLFWDASAERLGIGDMPTTPKDTALVLRSNSDAHAITIYEPVGANENWQLGVDADGDLGFYNSGAATASVTFDDSGNVGIGTDSPGAALHVDASAPEFRLSQSGTAKVRLRTSGDNYINTGQNLGIGTSSPDTLLELATTNTSSNENVATLRLTDADLSSAGGQKSGQVEFYTSDSTPGPAGVHSFINGQTENTSGLGTLVFGTGQSGSATERLRIDSSGNLLVGRTSASFGSDTGLVLRPNNDSYIIANDSPSLTMRRNNSDGAIAQFYKDGTTIGSLGTSATDLYIGSGVAGLRFREGGAQLMPWNTTTNAVNDNAIDLGKSDARFKDVYATNGTIQTSDRNEKQDIAELSDAEQRVAVACKGLLRKFRWKDSVAEKGNDARIHFGIIAQDLQDAFEAEGLDADDYAMFISTTWTDEETNEEKTRMGVRYSELLAFIISAI